MIENSKQNQVMVQLSLDHATALCKEIKAEAVVVIVAYNGGHIAVGYSHDTSVPEDYVHRVLRRVAGYNLEGLKREGLLQ